MLDESQLRGRRAVIWFLIATFGVTWAFWGLLFWFGIRVRSGDLLSTGLEALGMYVPGLSGLAVTRWVLRENWRTTTLDRLGDKRFLFWAWFLPPALVGATIVLTIIFGGARFDPNARQLREAIRASGRPMPAMSLQTIVLMQVASALSIGPPINSLFAVGEEVGWRGFLLPRLIALGIGEWPALLLSGAVWGCGMLP